MKVAGPITPRVAWVQRSSASTPTMRRAVRRHDRLIVQIQLIGGERARQFAVHEFLVGGHGVDRALETDDRAGAFLGGRAQREPGPARELAAGVGMARRLREAGMRADPHHGIDPMRPGDRVEGGANDIAGVGAAGRP